MFRVVGAIADSPAKRRKIARSLFDPIEERYQERVGSLEHDVPTIRSMKMHRCTEEQLSEIEDVLHHLEREWNLKGR
jgi:hypothetical protein